MPALRLRQSLSPAQLLVVGKRIRGDPPGQGGAGRPDERAGACAFVALVQRRSQVQDRFAVRTGPGHHLRLLHPNGQQARISHRLVGPLGALELPPCPDPIARLQGQCRSLIGQFAARCRCGRIAEPTPVRFGPPAGLQPRVGVGTSPQPVSQGRCGPGLGQQPAFGPGLIRGGLKLLEQLRIRVVAADLAGQAQPGSAQFTSAWSVRFVLKP